MKYSLDLPPPTVDRDFEPPKPERLSPVFRDLVGAVALFAEVGLIVFLLMGG